MVLFYALVLMLLTEFILEGASWKDDKFAPNICTELQKTLKEGIMIMI